MGWWVFSALSEWEWEWEWTFQSLGGCSRGYGSTSMRTTPLLSSRRPSSFFFSAVASTDLVPFANSSSGPTEPREYAPNPMDTVPLDCSNDVPVSSVAVPASASTAAPAAPRLTVPKPVVKIVVPTPVEGGSVRVLNLNEDQRWPAPSPLEESPERRRIQAVATTGRLATVSDMQSSTRAEMTTGAPPLVMMYAAWTRDTLVVATGRFFFRSFVQKS